MPAGAPAQTIAPATRPSSGIGPDDQRLARLEALAVVWGRLFLLHPGTASSAGAANWQRGLLESIPEIERASTPESFAAALNRTLFRHLGDPATLAAVGMATPELSLAAARPPGVAMLTGGVGLLTLADPLTPRPQDFPRRLAAALATVGAAELRVIDLRWDMARPEALARRAGWLSILLDSVRSSGIGITRERQGWSASAPALDSWYTQRWRHDPPTVFRPLSDPAATLRALYPAAALDSLRRPVGRTAIVVNNASIRTYEPLLVALQAQPDVAVVYERTGPLAEDGDTTVHGGVQIRFHLRRLLSADGSPGLLPDLVVDETIASSAIPDVARRAFEAKRAVTRPRFDERIAAAQAWPRSSAPPTREERIAGLIAMWVVTLELNPHIAFASTDWRRQLPAWIRRVEAAEGIASYYRVLNEILATLRDGHTRAAHPDMGFSGPWSIPAVVMRVEGRPVVVEVAPHTAGLDGSLRVGDALLAIDGRPVRQMEASVRPWISARDPDDFMWAHSSVLRSQQRDAPVTLTVSDGQRTREVTMRRSVMAAESYDTVTVRHLPGGVGYVNLRAIPADALLGVVDSLTRMSLGLVLDLRGYPVLGTVGDLAGRYIDRPVRSRGDAGGLPRLAVDQERVTRTLIRIPATQLPSTGARISLPTVLLVDGRAGSAAESVALALETAANITVVGSPTVGVTGQVTTMSLPGGGTLRFTGELMARPDGSRFFGIGIVPKVTAAPTIRGLRADRDEVLERGLQLLRRQIRTGRR